MGDIKCNHCIRRVFSTASPPPSGALTNPLRHPFSLSRSRSVYYSFLSTSLMLTVKGSNVGKYVARRRRELWVEDGRVTIKELPDEVLLEVFDSYLVYSGREKWIMLAHMCQRWRYIVFASPIRLNLRLHCKASKPVREMLDIWPPFPIIIDDYLPSEERADNIIAALEQNDRVCELNLTQLSSSVMGRFARAMQEPFLQLTRLTLHSVNGTLVVPTTFLGGSAPRLRSCWVDYLPFPALRNILLSASHLVTLRLWKIPHSGYISPEAMVACLAVATTLESLELTFQSPRSRPNRATRRPPPLIRTILPALTFFSFRGVSEYMEDFISRVDAPLLNKVSIHIFHQLSWDGSQLDQFIGRTEGLSAYMIADVVLDDRYPSIKLSLSQDARKHRGPSIELSTQCAGSDWQVSFLVQACGLLLRTLSAVDTLTVHESDYRLGPLTPGWEDDMENSQWLELFHPFTSVKNLYLSKKVVPLVAPALQQLAEERVTDVLPALQNLYVEGLQSSGPTQEGIGQFVAARRLSNHPVTVEPWD